MMLADIRGIIIIMVICGSDNVSKFLRHFES